MDPAISLQDSRSTQSFRLYPGYKESGVEWLGEIPAHWEVKRLKHVTECIDGKRVPLNSEQRAEIKGEYPYWGANGIVDYIDRWLFDEELVLLGEDGAPFFEPNKDVAFLVQGKVWVNNHAHVLRPKPMIEPKFLSHLLNVIDYSTYIDGSTRDKLTQDEMNGIPIQFPPLPEQRAIAAFLDRETAKIDALIAKRERMIALLQEKRAALISQAVTKGLDLNVPMKDSGVEWLGEIPKNWQVKKLKHLALALECGIQMGPFGSMLKNLSFEDTGIKVFGQENTIAGDFGCGSRWITAEQYHELKQYELMPGDIVVTRKGSLGNARLVPSGAPKGIIDSDTIRIRIECQKLGSEYLSLLLHDAHYMQEQIQSKKRGAVLGGLNTQTIADLIVLVPPWLEQTNILTYCREIENYVEALLGKINFIIQRLREYRTALISAAVTGKIDVRGEAS